MTGNDVRGRLARLGLWLVAANVAIVGLAAGLATGGGGGPGDAVRGLIAWCGIG